MTIQFGAIEADSQLVSGWAGDSAAVAYSLKIDPPHKAAAVRRLSDADPQAGVIDLADFGAIVDQILRNLLILLTSLASLALLAGAVIIANAVALAMLERRREIGIMKSVGDRRPSWLSASAMGLPGGNRGADRPRASRHRMIRAGAESASRPHR